MEKKDVLRGGLELVYQLRDDEYEYIQENAIQQALEVIRNRIDIVGLSEPTIQVQGNRRILVQLPGVENQEEIFNLLG